MHVRSTKRSIVCTQPVIQMHPRILDELIVYQQMRYSVPLPATSRRYILPADSISRSKCHAHPSVIPVFTSRRVGSIQIWVDDWAGICSRGDGFFLRRLKISLLWLRADICVCSRISSFSFLWRCLTISVNYLKWRAVFIFSIVNEVSPSRCVILCCIAYVQKLVALCRTLITGLNDCVPPSPFPVCALLMFSLSRPSRLDAHTKMSALHQRERVALVLIPDTWLSGKHCCCFLRWGEWHWVVVAAHGGILWFPISRVDCSRPDPDRPSRKGGWRLKGMAGIRSPVSLVSLAMGRSCAEQRFPDSRVKPFGFIWASGPGTE